MVNLDSSRTFGFSEEAVEELAEVEEEVEEVVGAVEGVVEEALRGQPGDHSQTDEHQVTIVTGTEFTTITLIVHLT